MKRLHILIAEPSLIIRSGLRSILFNIDSFGVDVAEIELMAQLQNEVKIASPDVLIINPLYCNVMNPTNLFPKNMKLKLVALNNGALPKDYFRNFDAILSIYDSAVEIENTLKGLIENTSKPIDEELSLREREIVIAIALGKSNKEIAEELFISAHTVMTHRKNIASKLKIHNPAGLTIYAIVNKLIDVSDVK